MSRQGLLTRRRVKPGAGRGERGERERTCATPGLDVGALLHEPPGALRALPEGNAGAALLRLGRVGLVEQLDHLVEQRHLERRGFGRWWSGCARLGGGDGLGDVDVLAVLAPVVAEVDVTLGGGKDGVVLALRSTRRERWKNELSTVRRGNF